MIENLQVNLNEGRHYMLNGRLPAKYEGFSDGVHRFVRRLSTGVTSPAIVSIAIKPSELEVNGKVVRAESCTHLIYRLRRHTSSPLHRDENREYDALSRFLNGESSK